MIALAAIRVFLSRWLAFVWHLVKPLVEDWPRTLPTAILIVLITWPLAHCDGVKDERVRNAEEVAEAQRKAIKRNAAAVVASARERVADQRDVAAAQKEQADAVQNLPQSSTTVRQRSRACVVLRHQDTQAGRVPRSC